VAALREMTKTRKLSAYRAFVFLVGTAGFEPATP
jgi:hypothetical protein